MNEGLKNKVFSGFLSYSGTDVRWGVVFLCLLLAGMFLTPAVASAAKDFNIKNDTQSFMFISGTTGNVGVSSSSPRARLQVDGAIYAGTTAPSHSTVNMSASGHAMFGGNVEIDGALYVDGFLYGNGSKLTGTLTVNPTANAVPISTGSVFIDSGIYAVGGNIGIGSANPRSALDINGAITSSSLGDSYVSGPMGFGSSAAMGAGNELGVQGSMTIGSAGYFGIAAPANGLIVSGNVGLGTSAPSVGLQVGTATISWPAGVSASNDAVFGGDVEIDGALYVDGFLYGNGSKLTGITSGTTISGLTANNVSKANATGTNFIDSAIYDVNGNVGIGTAIPQATLAVGGTFALTPSTVLSVAAGTGITPVNRSLILIAGSGGAVDITVDPQIAAGSDGQELVLLGTSNTNTVNLDNGTGLSLAGGVSFTMGIGDTLRLIYDAANTLWREISRSDN